MACSHNRFFNYYFHISKPKQMQVTKNNYVWLDVTNQSISLFNCGSLQLFGVQPDYQYLIDTMEDLLGELESGNKICIEVGRFF